MSSLCTVCVHVCMCVRVCLTELVTKIDEVVVLFISRVVVMADCSVGGTNSLSDAVVLVIVDSKSPIDSLFPSHSLPSSSFLPLHPAHQSDRCIS